MSLTLMYITNHPVIADIAQQAGVNRIWVDLEQIGKEARQAGMNTVKSFHTIADVQNMRAVVKTAELMVRINPIHERSAVHLGTKEEIERVIAAGADVIMLPMFRSAAEAAYFLRCVDGRARTSLLLETAEAAACLEEVLTLDGIDEIHIGLNDLHLAYGKKFMFELLSDGTVERLCQTIKDSGIPYGFGGIARVGYGMLPAEYIIAEHYALGSTAAILSRGFCDANLVADPEEVRTVFVEGVRNIRKKEREVVAYTRTQYLQNRNRIAEIVREIVQNK